MRAKRALGVSVLEVDDDIAVHVIVGEVCVGASGIEAMLAFDTSPAPTMLTADALRKLRRENIGCSSEISIRK